MDVLLWALSMEGIVVALAIVALIVMRWYLDAHTREVETAVQTLEPVLHAWLILNTDVETVQIALRGMSPHAAFHSLARLATTQVTFQRQQDLARVLRSEPWVGSILRHARSRLWWRRFDAVRLLSVVGGEEDAAVIEALIEDRSPAVRLVAMDAAAHLEGRPLVDRELDTLPLRQDAVQAYQNAAMARHPQLVADALIPRLSADAPTQFLNAWIDAAGALANPAALERVRELASHPLPEVRVHVARALRRLADPDTPPVLVQLLTDADWRVRAQAARALGALRCGIATEELVHAARDRSWWVRYRSALALAQIAGPARDALVGLTHSDDAMARDMSTMVAGLTSSAVVEMSEV